ncbi:MAG: hypothetical protein E7224_07245, partial [Clostridiales bacterium]|nr:hypothetical protein [Clostridiales bacterium]
MAQQKKSTSARSSGTSRKSSGSVRGMSAAEREKLQKNKRIRDEIGAILVIAIGAFLLVSIQTDAAGHVGHALQVLFKGLFGAVAYALPYCLIAYGLLFLARKVTQVGSRSAVFIGIIFLMATVLNSTRFLTKAVEAGWSFELFSGFFSGGVEGTGGGFIGMLIGFGLHKLIGMVGIYILCIAVIVIFALLIVNAPLSALFEKIRQKREAAKELHYMEEMAAKMEAEAAAEAAKNKPAAPVMPAVPAEPKKRKKPFDFSVQPEAAPAAAEAGKGLGDMEENKAAGSAAEDALKVEEPMAAEPVGAVTPEDEEAARKKAEADEAFAKEDYTDNQRQILGYVRDDDLFGGKPGGASFGYGLDGHTVEESSAVVAAASAAKAEAAKKAKEAEPEQLVISTAQ